MVFAKHVAWELGASVGESDLRDVLDITDEMGGYQLGHVVRAWCFEDLGDIDSAKHEWALATKGTGAFDIVYAPFLLQHEGTAAAISYFRNNRGRDFCSEVAFATLLAASPKEEDRKEAYDIARSLVTKATTASSIHTRTLLSVFLLLGKPDDAASLLYGSTTERAISPLTSRKETLRLIIGEVDAEEYLAEMGESRFRRSVTHYELALKAWGQRDLDSARGHFAESRRLGLIPTAGYRWSLAFLSLLDKDSGGPKQIAKDLEHE